MVHLGEQSEPKHHESVERFEVACGEEDAFDNIDLALIDLELGPAVRGSPGDFWGRDKVLPRLREKARWIPAILFSRYALGRLLKDVSPYGFDAILQKTSFESNSFYRREWSALKKYSRLNRIAALTGRTVKHLESLLDRLPSAEYGLGVAKEVDLYGREGFRECLALLELRSDKIFLDQLAAGFSGSSVFKMRCHADGRDTTWLLKVGKNPRKLTSELDAHRKMFVDGFTRRLSVPPLWWSPIWWRDVGLIAYEFEQEAVSFRSVTESEGFPAAVDKIRSLMAEFHGGGRRDGVVPRAALARLLSRLPKSPEAKDCGALVGALIDNTEMSALDATVRTIIGPEHGDLHGNNIIVSKMGAVLIDFAHYKGANESGIPLLDIAKLVVDTWSWGGMKRSLQDIVSGKILASGTLRGLLSNIGTSTTLTTDERRFWTAATSCIAAEYLTYPDTTANGRREIKVVLKKQKWNGTS